MPLEVGLRHSETVAVDVRLLVPAMGDFYTSFADMPPVFATAFLVGLVEWTAVNLVKPHLAPGQHSVGTLVDVSHTAATPAGVKATAEVELVAVEGRKLRFRVSCRDEAGPIGAGFHERAIVDGERFMAKVEEKRGR